MDSVTLFMGRCEEMTSQPARELMIESCLMNSTSTIVEFLYLTQDKDLLHTAQLKGCSKGWSMFFPWFIYSKSFIGISAGLFFFKEVHLVLFFAILFLPVGFVFLSIFSHQFLLFMSSLGRKGFVKLLCFRYFLKLL